LKDNSGAAGALLIFGMFYNFGAAGALLIFGRQFWSCRRIANIWKTILELQEHC
jgi:hypothetical protein